MNSHLLRALAVGFIALTASLEAKGPTVRLTVDAATLSEPLELLDVPLLAASNVLAGSFLGSARHEPPRSLPRYRVTFHVEPPAWMKRPVAPSYVLTYLKDPATGLGFIYLPARGEDGYRLNVGTVMRDGRDGRWQSASPEWARRINTFLP